MGLSWAHGERLVISNADGTLSEVLAGEARTPATTRLALAGHALFTRSDGAGLAECSRAYRAALLEAAEGAEAEADAGGGGGDDASQLYAAHVVWEFCEAVYLSEDLDDDDDMATRLSVWYRSNYGDLHAATEAFHDAPDGPVSDDEGDDEGDDANDADDDGDDDGLSRFPTGRDGRLWRLVIRLAAAGSRDSAVTLLTARLAALNPPSSPPHPLAIASQVLGACPDVAPARARANGEWAAWQDTAVSWRTSLSSGALAPHPPLGALLDLLGGRPEALTVSRHVGCWEEALLAHLAYARGGYAATRGGDRRASSATTVAPYGVPPSSVPSPATPASAIAAASAAACVAHPPPEGVCGGALTEAALGNPAEALLRLAASTATAWHSAHLGDLLLRAGALPNVPSALAPAGAGGAGAAASAAGRHATATRDAFVTALATGLAWRPATWRIAVDYLSLLAAASPGTAAAGALPALIAGVPAGNAGGGGEPALLKATALASPAGRRRLAARAAAASAAAGNAAAELLAAAAAGGVGGVVTALAYVAAVWDVYARLDAGVGADGDGAGDGEAAAGRPPPPAGMDVRASEAVVAALAAVPDALRGVVAYDVARRGAGGLGADALYAVLGALEGDVGAAGVGGGVRGTAAGGGGLLAKRLAANGVGVEEAVDAVRGGVLRQLAVQLMAGGA
ncbi:hypothetical protein BU14_0071s0079 [Porphyra umbilicalis]|uniref:Nuclear pore complex protein Nup85 n=1 Tax=Porphyra umbilicalis TaxID=2786 RepID=A0A1X6PGE8_PORUM|nr:hypothetical protein BU14_0071s0079 [Porphyra umbilicalis]|eukprot:OSX79825.1 hypothetical protein BU14_0071s0079 [Porphyra umbilicalis]